MLSDLDAPKFLVGARLSEEPPVGDEHHTPQSEPLTHHGDRGRQGLGIAYVAREELKRQRASIAPTFSPPMVACRLAYLRHAAHFPHPCLRFFGLSMLLGRVSRGQTSRGCRGKAAHTKARTVMEGPSPGTRSPWPGTTRAGRVEASCSKVTRTPSGHPDAGVEEPDTCPAPGVSWHRSPGSRGGKGRPP